MATSLAPGSDPRTDSDLLEHWSAGQVQAGSQLVERHFTAVRQYLRSRLAPDVDDLTQETFLVCLANRSTFRGESHVRTFLIGIARHLMLAARRARVRGDVPTEDAGDVAGPAARDNEGVQMLMDAVDRLPPDLRAALEMTYWAGLTESEIAHRLDCPRGTIASRIRRAKERLRTLLQTGSRR